MNVMNVSNGTANDNNNRPILAFDVQACLDDNAKLLEEWTALLGKHG
jgi:hypothetical protein